MENTITVSVNDQMDRHDKILEALDRLNPEFAEYLRKKYDEKRTDFDKALMEAVPSTKARDWAKTSCNKCYGKGTITINGTDRSCRCVDKNYSKWFKSFSEEYYKRDNQ